MERNKFKIGDIVVWNNNDFVGKIIRPCFSYNDSWYLNESYNSCSESNMREATPTEIKKYNKENNVEEETGTSAIAGYSMIKKMYKNLK